MKIRQGFVSNSSTTSFCIFGAGTSLNEDDCDDLYGMAEKEGLEIHYGQDYGEYNIFLGVSWSSIKDDETGQQFKERVAQAVHKMDPSIDPNTCTTHEQAYRDG